MWAFTAKPKILESERKIARFWMRLTITGPSIEQRRISGLLSDRGFPALMSLKEPALRMLKERYSESFAMTKGAE